MFGLLAGVAFVACTNDDDPAGASPVNGGNKVATAPKYMTVNFVMPGATTRSDTDAAGTTDESTINSAAFLFFKNNAQVADPFVIDAGEPDAVSDGTEGKDDSWDPTDQAPDNAVVVLENPEDIPTSMVVLVNVDVKALTGKTEKADVIASLKTKTIAELQAAAAFEKPTAKGPFKMTNAVYNEGGQNVIGAPVGADNVKETPAQARQNPVKVYIEREAAKVSVKNSATAQTINSGLDKVTVTLKKWALVFENTQSSLIKNLGTSYNFGWTWNDASAHRSYWAETKGYTANNTATYAADNNAFGAAVYTSENTISPTVYTPATEKNTPTQNPTAVIVTAQLTKDGVDANMNLYKYLGGLYVENDVRTYLINSAPYYKKTSAEGEPATYEKLVGTDYEDLVTTTKPEGGKKSQVKINLVIKADVANVYTKNENGTMSAAITNAEANEELAKGQLVEMYAGGASYYYVPIKQHDDADNTKDVYGIVRNHFYQLDIKSVTGLGTAVPVTDQVIVPEDPEPSNKYYIGAELNVLQWAIVSQSVDLK